jgi:hypothetical protein
MIRCQRIRGGFESHYPLQYMGDSSNVQDIGISIREHEVSTRISHQFKVYQ